MEITLSYLSPSADTSAHLLFIDRDNQILSTFNLPPDSLAAALSLSGGGHLKKAHGSSTRTLLANGSLLLLIRVDQRHLDLEHFHQLATAAATAAGTLTLESVSLDISGLGSYPIDAFHQLRHFTVQLRKAGYRFREFKTGKKNRDTPAQVKFHLIEQPDAERALCEGMAIGSAVNLARTLGDRPGNHCTPSHLADEALAMAEGYPNLAVEIHEEADLHEMGMGAFLSVTAGSDQPAKLIEFRYEGGGEDDAPYVLVGKGVTFDTGGISIKAAAGMDEMKFDMCGAASVFGAVQAVAELMLPINLIGLVPAAENMPSGGATKPGDIVTSMKGKTIEVLNTDAEGRMLLCDALTYAHEFNPRLIIDIATLTGACVVALGTHATGLYANRDDLAAQLLHAGEASGDRAWRMPLWKDYTKQLESRFADLGNVGGPKAGSVTAACFLQEFIDDVPWAHLDIAGSAWNSAPTKGATGRPVELLMHFILDGSL